MIFVQTKAFVKDLSKAKMSDKHLTKFIAYLAVLSTQKPLPAEAKDHWLSGDWNDFREFHVSGDLLVICQIENKVIKLVRLGTHSQLFKG
ncbi:MAG: type II toxin-antitoxin system mRNA interferase toxin, RelE/StbE family [Gammaproteobacteria bacterium]|nr:MAG: type II toxin-antitoxin system mRNA interferase toxin, RelE/StbE family [Gammaproteobacteria bacterium]